MTSGSRTAPIRVTKMSSNGIWPRMLLAAYIVFSLPMTQAGGANKCCSKLSAALPGLVSLPGSDSYNSSVSSYWAQQQTLISPSCIFAPATASDVSTALSKVLVPNSCVFAVRGGGHASLTAASNTNGGVTIDLRGINEITFNADKTTVSIGGGQTIGNVYTKLAEYGLTVPAARDFSVGIGGSTIGGGFGYFSTSLGFAANSVIENEVVLANGAITLANQENNNDLWRALKGGGNNFGIITKFTFKTSPLEDIWAGDIVRNATRDNIEGSATALYNFVTNPNYDPKAYAFVTFGFAADEQLVLTEYTYAAPVPNAPAFAELLNVSGEPVLDSTAIKTVPELSKESDMQSPYGLQQITFSLSVENNAQVIVDSWEILKNSTYKIQNFESASWGLTIEPVIPLAATAGSGEDNTVINLGASPNGLILIICSANFARAADYPVVNKAVKQLLTDLINHAKSLGVYNPYIDMNHAMEGQKVLASYGSENLDFLKATAIKYDPTKVFQKLMPGGFKL
ncbi:FAD binding domain protein [Nemania abortiva]|nr:FAD binding domain protein [Nemania abortiva]